MNVFVKFGDSSSNGFRYIQGADFVSNEQDAACPNSAKSLSGVPPKNGVELMPQFLRHSPGGDKWKFNII